ncbi:alpha-1,3/1,6-mannosyltransferase ALG2-like [Anoplophora glabripennis]|uniref:alpha-1,3/1,6-mannosyltransferase ALG2-like n=1 Tax=Anoplophora glabripennis TaxID=217634 RepID=UPI000873877D|nr:alpha-1,3/1,6-mannosyltransferase ALG2-like [Anoplophora glabripennis]
MEQNATASDVDDSVQERPQVAAPHVLILHEKLIKRKTDRYVINLGLAFSKIGYKVTMFTSQYDKNENVADVSFSDKIDVQFSGWWIPRSVLGLFRSNMSALKAAWMAFRIIFYPPEPKPDIIVLDVSKWALYFLNLLTDYKLFYMENFLELKITDACFEHSKIYPSLLEAKWIKLADEIIVETIGFAEILKKSFPSLMKQPQIMYPSIDIGLWEEPAIKIQRIIPDLLSNTILFLTVGKFRRSSNFRLALDAFEMLLELIDDKSVTKRFQLVIAGNCKTLDEKFYYNEVMAAAKERICASQVTFLKQLPVIHEKTLIMESAIMIHPAKNDVYSEFLLKAMSLGKPIVATNKGIASKLLVHRLSGVIIESDPRMFAVAMKKLMMSPHLQVFLGDMAKDAFDKNYSFESLCEKVDKLVNRSSSCDSKTIISGSGN